MIEIPTLQDAAFPMAWWLFWFAVAFLVYGLLIVWFWRSFRRHDRAVSQGENEAIGGQN